MQFLFSIHDLSKCVHEVLLFLSFSVEVSFCSQPLDLYDPSFNRDFTEIKVFTDICNSTPSLTIHSNGAIECSHYIVTDICN